MLFSTQHFIGCVLSEKVPNIRITSFIHKGINLIEQLIFLNKPPPRKKMTHKVHLSYGLSHVVHTNIILTLISDFWFVGKRKDTAPLLAARAADLAMANADDDPAVSAVVGDGGEGAPRSASRSESPTPSPAPKLAVTVAALRAHGEEPGVADEDTLLSAGVQEENGEAVHAQERRNRKKEKAFVKTKASNAGNKGENETDSDSEKGKGKGKRMGKEYKSAGKAPASKGRARQTKEIPVVLDSSTDSEHERRASGSRHTSVHKSTIYTTFQGLLDPVRRRTQSLMLIRDGCPPKTGATNKTLNYKLVLQAARQVLAKKECTNFIEAMESAFKDPS